MNDMVVLKSQAGKALSGTQHMEPQTPRPSPHMDEADQHLARLLAPTVETPWWESLVENIRDLIEFNKLPPLVTTSKPVAVRDIWGDYRYGKYSGPASLAIHGAVIALLLGVAAIVLQILELLFLPFWPGSSGFSSVFTGFYPVFVVVLLAAMIWLETLLARARFIPTISFVEQPPTYKEAFAVQRFQSSLSGFATVTRSAAICLKSW